MARAKGESRRLPVWSLVGLAVVAGLALGRFALAPGGDDEPAAGPAVDVSSGDPADRIAALEAAVDADPDDARTLALLGGAYLGRAAELGDPALYELAGRAFDRAAAVDPGEPALLVGRGALALSLHRFDEAEAFGRTAVAALPANVGALAVLVDAQVELGAYDDAADTLQTLLDLDPGLTGLARASYLRELRGDLDGAEDAMAAAAAASAPPYDLAVVTSLLGGLRLASGDLDGALASYEEALVLHDGLLDAELGRARVLAARGDLDEAVEAVQAVVDRFPSPTATSLLVDLHHVAGDTEAEAEAVELVRVTTRLQEAAGQVVDLELALFEADVADDPDRAVELAEAAHDARPDNVFADDALAWSLYRAGDVEAAVGHARDAARLGTAVPLLQYHAAEVLAAAGEDAEAAEHLALAVRGGTAFTVRHADAVADLAARLGVDLAEQR